MSECFCLMSHLQAYPKASSFSSIPWISPYSIHPFLSPLPLLWLEATTSFILDYCQNLLTGLCYYGLFSTPQLKGSFWIPDLSVSFPCSKFSVATQCLGMKLRLCDMKWKVLVDLNSPSSLASHTSCSFKSSLCGFLSSPTDPLPHQLSAQPLNLPFL